MSKAFGSSPGNGRAEADVGIWKSSDTSTVALEIRCIEVGRSLELRMAPADARILAKALTGCADDLEGSE